MRSALPTDIKNEGLDKDLALTQGSTNSQLASPLRLALILAPVILGGWFLYIAVSSYTPLFSHAIALPESGSSALMLDDFVVFHTAGKAVPAIGGEVYDPQTISALQAEQTGQDAERVAVLPYFNPPPALLPLALLGLLSLGSAAAVWLTGSAMVALAGLRALAPRMHVSPEAALVLTLGAISSLPVYQAVVHGQMTFVLLAGFCLYGAGILRPERSSYVVLGLVLLALKPVFLPLPLLYLVLRGRFHLILRFAAVEALLFVIAAALFGPRLPFDYVAMSLDALSWDEVNGISTYGMFGWTGFWRGILGPDAHVQQTALTTVSALATIAAFAATFARRDNPRLALAAIVIAGLLNSPHSYSQDLVLLVIPVIMLMQEYRDIRIGYSVGLLAWFAAFVHFETLALTGVGAANLGIILFAGFVLVRAADLRMPQLGARTAAVNRRPATIEIAFSQADAAGG
jgi:hypothetical protein